MIDPAHLRSLLFVPATRPDRFERAASAGADAVIVDLEDAVPEDGKDEARTAALAWAGATGVPGPVRCLRINSPRTTHGLRDLLALAATPTPPALVMLPKVESPGEIDVAAGVLGGGVGGEPRILALIESARGLSAAEAIAAHPRVGALVLGGADLAADLGAEMAWEPLLWARGRLVAAAATTGIPAIDVPTLELDGGSLLAREADAARRLGFSGKLAIHPTQIAAINAAFTPTPQAAAQAQRIVAAADRAGGGVCLLDGRMVDAPVVAAARRTLARVHARPSGENG